ncbi:MAG: hypothetical protein LBK82_08465 [Planctomycetaceae bacterium]|jgi:Tfp pilus assembly protein PilF|nr:hypothetical protein [Planctomycetaceae bacterium]
MRLNYRLLWIISFVLVIFGFFCLHGLYCFANSEEELNRKAGELFALGIQAERQEKNADAEKIYEQCLRFAKENNISRLESSVLHRLAILKAKEQKIAESEQYFRDALKLNRENIALLCDFAKLYSDQKNYDNAETILKNALLIAPNHRRTLFNLGFIIALQKDRQTEGLRYLKLAIGEIAAYQELAKIYRQQGNNAQAEFAEQRATLFQKSQTSPSADTMTSPTVPMDEQTKKELIQHVKEELLRLETAEIAATPQTETIKIITPQPKPLSTESSATEPSATKSSLAEPVLAKPLPTKPSLAEPIHDPFLVVESQKIEDLKKDQSFADNIPASQESFLTPTVDKIEPSPAETNSNIGIGEKLSETTKPLQTFPEPQQTLKILKPEPLTNEPVKIFPQNVQDNQKTNDIRTLPATDFRISNSTEGEAVIPQQPEIHTLTIVPLDDETINKSIPEYTAISVRKIPLTEKTSAPSQTEEKKISVSTKTEKKEEKNSVSRFQNPASSGSAATISMSLNKTPNQQNTSSDKINSDFSARLHLEQPINLITFNSQRSQPQQRQAPVPTFDSSEKPLKESAENRPENQRTRISSNESAQSRPLDLESRTTQNNFSNKNNPNEQLNDSVSSQRPSKSILRPGAGKIGIQEGLDSYVYVDADVLKNDTASGSSEPVEKDTAQKSVTATNSATNSITKSVAESFSLIRPMPGKLANRLTNSSRSSQIAPAPPIETGTETITETTTKTTETTATPTVTARTRTVRLPVEKTPQPEIPLLENIIAQNKPNIDNNVSIKPEINKKSDVQFSSTQAPNVLKFEIASTTKSESSDKSEIVNESDKPNKIVTQEQISTPAKPVPTFPVTSDSVQSDSLQQTADNTFQPPTVLKFGLAQSEIISKPTPAQPKPIQSTPVQSVPVQETEPLLATHPEPAIVTKPETLPDSEITETTISEVPNVPTVPAIAAIQTTPAVSEMDQPLLPSTQPNSTEPITDSDSDSIAISNPKPVPAIPVPTPVQDEIEEVPVQKPSLPTQQPEPKTEIADNTSPQPTPAHVEAFLPILTVRQPEEVAVQQPPPVPMPESPRLNTNLKFKAAHETAATPPDEPIIAEQTTDQQLKIATNPEVLKFVVPNHQQQKMLQNQENVLSKPVLEMIPKPVEIVQKPTENEIITKPVEIVQKPIENEVVTKPLEIIQKPTENEVVTKPVEIVQKPTENEVVTKPVEIVQKPTENEVVTKPVEIVQKSTEDKIVTKPVEIVRKPTENEIVFKPIEVIQKPMENEIVTKPIEIVRKPTEEIVSKPEPVLTLIPLNGDVAQKEAERKLIPEQTQKPQPIVRSDAEEIFVLKKIEKTQPRLKTEMETAERLTLNSISRETNLDKLEELTKKIEIEEEEPVGFATPRKIPPVVAQQEVNETVDEFLKPKENFGKHPIFSLDSSPNNNFQEKNTSPDQEEKAGFARSSKYSKKTQSDSSQNTTK